MISATPQNIYLWLVQAEIFFVIIVISGTETYSLEQISANMALVESIHGV